MSSRTRQTNRRSAADTRTQLIEAGIRLLEEVGPEALQARRIAADIGASTMTVYTHFEGMPGLLAAIIGEAFVRFGAALASVAPTDDPVADLLAMGLAYRNYAVESPQRYRLMWGLTSLHTHATHDLTTSPVGEGPGGETFEQLVAAVRRMIDAERIRADPPRAVAARIWGLIHGVVLLELTGQLGTDGQALTSVLQPAIRDLLAGMGAAREELELSVERARRAVGPEIAGATTEPA